LADYIIVVTSDARTGGTWAGAIEALKIIGFLDNTDDDADDDIFE
jgi:hypothetical protein